MCEQVNSLVVRSIVRSLLVCHVSNKSFISVNDSGLRICSVSILSRWSRCSPERPSFARSPLREPLKPQQTMRKAWSFGSVSKRVYITFLKVAQVFSKFQRFYSKGNRIRKVKRPPKTCFFSVKPIDPWKRAKQANRRKLRFETPCFSRSRVIEIGRGNIVVSPLCPKKHCGTLINFFQVPNALEIPKCTFGTGMSIID